MAVHKTANIPEPSKLHYTCQHLQGPEYEEYIIRTQTRVLGGISSDFRAKTARSLFPYKPFPPIRKRRRRRRLDSDEDSDADRPHTPVPETDAELAADAQVALSDDESAESSDELVGEGGAEILDRKPGSAESNLEIEEKAWTRQEQQTFDRTLKANARWEVDYAGRFVKGRRCTGTTTNTTEVCDKCTQLAEDDKAFLKAVYRVRPSGS